MDGRDLVYSNVQADIDVINAGLFPAGSGESHTFQIQDPGPGLIRTVTLVSADVALPPEIRSSTTS